MDTPVYPDAEQVLEDLTADIGYSCKYLPADFDQRLDSGEAVILISRVGGNDDGVTDRAWVQTAVWGRDRPTARKAADKVAAAVASLVYGGQVGSVWVDTTATRQGQVQVPDLDPDDRRILAVYQVETRRQ